MSDSDNRSSRPSEPSSLSSDTFNFPGREMMPAHQAAAGAGSNVLNYSPAAFTNHSTSPQPVHEQDTASAKVLTALVIPKDPPSSSTENVDSDSVLSTSTPHQPNGLASAKDKDVEALPQANKDPKPTLIPAESVRLPQTSTASQNSVSPTGEKQSTSQRPATAPPVRPVAATNRKTSLKQHPADRPTSPATPKQSVFGRLFGDKDKDQQKLSSRPASSGLMSPREPSDKSDGESSDGGIAGGFAAFARRTSAGIAGRNQRDRDAVKAAASKQTPTKPLKTGKNAAAAAESPSKKDPNWSESDTERVPSIGSEKTDGERASERASWRELVEKQTTKLKRGSSVGSSVSFATYRVTGCPCH
jgi:hypothetical protein